MTKFLLIITLILLVVGIPVSAICWWNHSFSYGYGLLYGRPFPAGWLDNYWALWAHWVKVALIILAALWILDLVLWIKAKREENEFYRVLGIGMNLSPSSSVENYADFIADKDGVVTDVRKNKSKTEPHVVAEPVESIPIVESWSPPFGSGQDFLSKYKYHENEHAKGETDSTKESKMKNYENDARVFLLNQEVSRLVEEGGLISNDEAIKLRQYIENSVDSPKTYLDTKRFLQAIRYRPSK